MNRFERSPVRTLTVIVAVILVALVAGAEWTLSAGTDEIRLGESLTRPPRHLVLREWQPDTVFRFGTPEIRRRRPGGDVLDDYVLDVDRDGYIKPARVHDDADVEIVFVGGSTTECMYVTPDLRFPHLAGRLVERELGVRVNAMNAGKSGNNLMHSLLAVIAKVLPQRPDYLVVMHNVNDLAVLTRGGGYWNDSSDYALVRKRTRDVESVVRDIREMTVPHTYRAIRRTLSGGLIGAAYAATPPEADLERAGEDFEAALRSVVALARAWGIEPVLMTQAQRGSTKEELEGDYLAEANLGRRGFTAESFESAHVFFNAITRHVAMSEETPLVDLAREAWEREDLYDGLHFTDQGSQRAARRIAETLAPIIAERQRPR